MRIGDDCEVGASTTIDCGAIGDTVLGNDVRLDNQIQIAHNVEIGDHTAMAGMVGLRLLRRRARDVAASKKELDTEGRTVAADRSSDQMEEGA